MPRLDSIDSTPIAWGSHICTFYRSPFELRRSVGAYSAQGWKTRGPAFGCSRRRSRKRKLCQPWNHRFRKFAVQ